METILKLVPDIGLFTENCVSDGNYQKYWLLEPNIAVKKDLENVVSKSPIHQSFMKCLISQKYLITLLVQLL